MMVMMMMMMMMKMMMMIIIIIIIIVEIRAERAGLKKKTLFFTIYRDYLKQSLC